jgi:hypothetical protein
MTSNVPLPFARAGGDLIRRGALVALSALALLAGCSDYPLSPVDQQKLAQARATWAEKGAQDYTVEARIACFCPSHLTQWTRLTVRGGHIIAADPVESLPEGVTPDISGWLTVEEEFERLTDPPEILQEIEVRFDSQLGFPTFIRADCGPNVQDCGSVHEMRNVRFPAIPLIRS